MISPEDVRQLAQCKEQQCLTVYLNTGPNIGRSAFGATFRNLLRALLAHAIAGGDRKVFARVVAKVTNFLDQHKPNANSMLIFGMDRDWRQYSSRVPVRDELWWGPPNINQLLWLLEEYRPYGVLIADQQKVQFLAVRLGELEESREFTTDIDTSGWRKQMMGASGRGSSLQKGGKDLEKFSSRYMEHVHSFWKGLHRPLSDLIERYHIKRLVVAGNKSLVPDFVKSLPPVLSTSVMTQVHMDSLTDSTEAVRRIYPEIVTWERKRGKCLVSELLNSATVSQRAAVGIEPVLKYVQEGRVQRLLVVKGYDREVLHCAKCQHVTTNHSPVCRRCSSNQIERGSLAAVLPRLVAQFRVPVEVVQPEAGAELAKSGGIGVLLRF